jgi:hypothetical protein
MKSLSSIKPAVLAHTTTIGANDFTLHEFTASQWESIIKPVRNPAEDATAEDVISAGLDVITIGMEGVDHVPTKEDHTQLTSKLSEGTLREYMGRLCRLNDLGIDLVREAEKKYEAAVSTTTK